MQPDGILASIDSTSKALTKAFKVDVPRLHVRLDLVVCVLQKLANEPTEDLPDFDATVVSPKVSDAYESGRLCPLSSAVPMRRCWRFVEKQGCSADS